MTRGGLERGGVSLTPPLWMSVTMILLLVAALSSLFAAIYAGERIRTAISDIERAHTIGGWRNEAVVEEAVSSDRGIARLRTLRGLAFAGFGILLAGSLAAAGLEMRDRKRKMTVLASMTEEWKAKKSGEIRGFIALHAGTLAQKRVDLRTTNSYGIVDESEWNRELIYFVNRVLRPACGADAELFSFMELRAMVEKQISMLG